MNHYTIPLPEALSLARKRGVERYAAVQADLDDLNAAGCAVNISTAQLIVLEDAGLLYDFQTGLVEDFTQAPDRPGAALLDSRQQFHTQVAQTCRGGDSGEVLRELTAAMTVAL